MNSYRPGDIVEIITEKGLAYVHLTHEHDSYPPVIRLLRGIHAERPDDIADCAARTPFKIVMIPLVSALNRLGLAHRKVGERQLQADERPFPTFRMPIRDKQGEIVYWWFWDGRGLTYSSELEEKMNSLPMREVISANAFLQELLSGARDSSR